jgi:putative inorganic carbon (HCO3(-)) transporter
MSRADVLGASSQARWRGGGAVAVVLVVMAMVGGLGLVVDNTLLVAIALGSCAAAGIAILFQPDVAILAFVALLYSNAAVVGIRFHGLPTLVGAALPLLLLIPLTAILARRQPLIAGRPLGWMAAYLLVLSMSALLSTDPGVALGALWTFAVEGLLLFLLIINVVRSGDVLYRIVWVLLIVGSALAMATVHQAMTGSYGNEYLGFAQLNESNEQGWLNEDRAVIRQGGPIGSGEKNRYAQMLVCLLPLGLLRFKDERSLLLRWTAAAMTGIIAWAVTLTYSRGAAVGVVLTLIVMVFMRYLRPLQILAVVLCLGVLLLASPNFRERLSTIQSVPGVFAGDTSRRVADGAITGRLTQALAAVNMFLDHPLLGVGPGLYPSLYREYAREVGLPTRQEDREPHSLYLGIAAETGVLGSLAFSGVLFIVLRDLARARRRPPEQSRLASVASSYLLAIVAYLSTGIFLHLSFARYFWLWVALGAAAGHVALRGAEPVPSPAAENVSTVRS